MTEASPGTEEAEVAGDDAIGLSPEHVQAVTQAIEDENLDQVRTLVEPLHSADVADLVEQLEPDERRVLVDVIRGFVASEVLPHLGDALLDDVLEHLGVQDVAAAVAELDVDDAIDIIEDLDEDEQREVLNALPAFERLQIEEGLAFPEDSAGRLMQRDFMAIPAYWTVGQTIDYMRRTDDLPDEFYEIFVVDPSHHPMGTVPLYRAMRTKRPVLIGDIMESDPILMPVEMDQEDVAYQFQQYDLTSAGVIDDSNRLIGVITVDDVVDVIHEEAEEDIMRLAGVGESDIFWTVSETTKRRFLWLLVNLGTAVLASIVISWFGATIEQIVALAILMPIVASMGGNAGTQTMTVTVRALATRDLTATNAFRVVSKELIVGFINGVLFAALVAVIAGIWFGGVALGGVIAAAMVINMIVAALAGILIPLGFSRFGTDPAVAATVLVTTVTDVVGFFAFLGLGAWLLL
ncbi:MAG: magnesium transporter [Alphaproteobacteria bacterium]|nr:magnesium transporter [Alphaproteobacteria bacterium]|tara:strand:- start:600 stop:1991 length:1392 start_codon:yes stop_codon:yes gene_type:complete